MPAQQWARLQTDVNCGLRRGAWYTVVSVRPRELVLRIEGKSMAVPRTLLELRMTPPSRWTVVPAPRDATGLPGGWSADYAVCPNCRHRAQLQGRPATLRCPGCNGLFEVAWDEPYLAAS